MLWLRLSVEWKILLCNTIYNWEKLFSLSVFSNRKFLLFVFSVFQLDIHSVFFFVLLPVGVKELKYNRRRTVATFSEGNQENEKPKIYYPSYQKICVFSMKFFFLFPFLMFYIFVSGFNGWNREILLKKSIRLRFNQMENQNGCREPPTG